VAQTPEVSSDRSQLSIVGLSPNGGFCHCVEYRIFSAAIEVFDVFGGTGRPVEQ